MNPLWNAIPKMALRSIARPMVLSLGLAAYSQANILYVKKPGTGSGSGPWGSAYTDLVPALINAQPGDEIWVASGTYYPTDPAAPSPDRNAKFKWPNGVAVYGGFAGSETEFSQRDISQNPVILSGDLGVPGTVADNTITLFEQASGAALVTSFDGLQFTGANGGGVFYMAPGLYLNLSNCSFSNNSVSFGAGAVISGENYGLNVAFSSFTNNTATGDGGAIFRIRGSGSPAVIKNSRFEMNQAGQWGGAISGSENGFEIINCLFRQNTAAKGGAIALGGTSGSRILSSTFVSNSAMGTSGKGGAVYKFAGFTTDIQNSIFWQNTAGSGLGMQILSADNFSGLTGLGNNVIQGGLVSPAVHPEIPQNPVLDRGGNLSSDPLLVSFSNPQLSPGSPAINAGIKVSDWDAVYPRSGAIFLDLDGNNRFRGSAQVIDIGALEFQGASQYTITASATGCGTISPSGPVTVQEFADQSFTLTPKAGCRLSALAVDNVNQPIESIGGTFTLQNVTASHSLAVTFVSSNTIPFAENWESGISRWDTDLKGTDGISETDDRNRALCFKDAGTTVSADWSGGTSNAFSIKFRVNQPIIGPSSSFIRLEYPSGSAYILDLIPGFLHIGHVFAQPYTYDVWHELRAEVDLPNSEIRWYFDGASSPFYTTPNARPEPFSGIRFSGGSLNTCLDDLYMGNEHTLTVNATTNGVIDVNPGWTRGVSGPPGKYVYRQIPGGAFPNATLQARPADGFVLDTWTGDASASGSNATASLSMNGPKTVSALFKDAPTYTVERKWGSVNLPSITVKEGIIFDVMQGIPTNITPLPENFSNWVVVPGPNFKGAFIPSDQNRKGKIKGGNVQLVAYFFPAEVKVEVKDLAYQDGDADNTESEPRIRITNVGKAILEDVFFEYYFHSECLNDPTATITDPRYVGKYPVGGGNYKLLFHTGTQLPKGGVVEISTGRMEFSCLQTEPTCPKIWKWDNDYSLDPKAVEFNVSGKRKSIKEYRTTRLLPVYEADPGMGYRPTVTAVRGTTIPGGFRYDDPAPDPAVKTPTQYAIPLSTDLPIPPQTPNVVTIHAFPLGTALVNGSFESDTLGWSHFPEVILPAPPAPRWEIGYQSMEAQAYDGFKFLRIKASTSGSIEGAFLRIGDTDPAFAALMSRNGRGLTGNGTVFSAWVRLPAPGTGTVRILNIDGSGVFSGNETFNLDPAGNWSFISSYIPQFNAYEEVGGWRSIRIAIVAGDNSTPIFDIDGVTLTPGNTYSAPGISQKLSNTRGSPIQTRIRLPSEQPGLPNGNGTEIIANVEYDKLGRESKTYLPYAEPCPAQSCNPVFQPEAFTPEAMSRANQHYDSDPADGLPDAGGYAYTEKSYENDQVTTIEKVGKPGSSYQIGSGHVALQHYSGVSDLGIGSLTGNSGTFENPGNKNDPVFAYQHMVDEDGKEAMEWKNGFGQVVKTAAVLNKATGEYAETRNFYDARGNLIKVLPPLSCVKEDGTPSGIADCADPVTYEYDDENRLILESHPDAGETRYLYDHLGRKRATQTYRQFLAKAATITVYDDFGRILYTGEYVDKDPGHTTEEQTTEFLRGQIRTYPGWPQEPEYAALRTRYFYDVMPAPLPSNLVWRAPELRLYPDELTGSFENTKTRLCAVVQFHDPMEGMDPALPVSPVSSVAYRYDRLGRVIATYNYNGFITEPGRKLQKSETIYDLAGRVIENRHFLTANQVEPEKIEYFAYDARGQLSEMRDKGGASLARYEYFQEDGKVRKMELGAGSANPITVQYEYHINGAISKINSTKKNGNSSSQEFSQRLYYDLLPGGLPGLFNGNIARQEYSLGGLPQRSVEYQYDRLNRLVNAAYNVSGPGTDPKEFDEQIEYLLDGRIAELRRGDGVGASPDGGKYFYNAKSHALARVGTGRFPNDPRAVGTDARHAFLYDEDGNMVWDESKNMEITYDYRGLPTSFVYTKNGLEYALEARYDHSGNRISKVEFTRGSSSGGGQSSNNELLIDSDPSHSRDYGLLADAHQVLKAQYAGVNEDPGTIVLYVVVDPAERKADLRNFTAWEKIQYQGGTIRTVLKGLPYGTPDYFAVINRRSEVLQLVAATHYTGFGNEIRQDFQVNPGTKTLIDLPQGLGRYEQSGGELFYVKNHLGSTMLATRSGGLTYQSYDYFPYGQQKVVQNAGTDKVRETFTGKELDEETGIGGLYYFGARYYDADLGYWLSPDAKRQFPSPYSYSSSPINGIDPDGNDFIRTTLRYQSVGSRKNYFAMGVTEYFAGTKENPGKLLGAFPSWSGGQGTAIKPGEYQVDKNLLDVSANWDPDARGWKSWAFKLFDSKDKEMKGAGGSGIYIHDDVAEPNVKYGVTHGCLGVDADRGGSKLSNLISNSSEKKIPLEVKAIESN